MRPRPLLPPRSRDKRKRVAYLWGLWKLRQRLQSLQKQTAPCGSGRRIRNGHKHKPASTADSSSARPHVPLSPYLHTPFSWGKQLLPPLPPWKTCWNPSLTAWQTSRWRLWIQDFALKMLCWFYIVSDFMMDGSIGGASDSNSMTPGSKIFKWYSGAVSDDNLMTWSVGVCIAAGKNFIKKKIN